jgi:hypothetical protein
MLPSNPTLPGLLAEEQVVLLLLPLPLLLPLLLLPLPLLLPLLLLLLLLLPLLLPLLLLLLLLLPLLLLLLLLLPLLLPLLLLLLLLLLLDLRSPGWPRGVPSTSLAAAAPRRSRTTATAAASSDSVPESAATLLIWSVPSTYIKSSAKTGIDDSQPAQGQSGGNVPEAPWWHEPRGGVRAFC